MDVKPGLVRLETDLYARDWRGYAPARIPDGVRVSIGDLVIATEPQDWLAAPAWVVDLDGERGVAYLNVDRTKVIYDSPGPVVRPLSRRGDRIVIGVGVAASVVWTVTVIAAVIFG